LVVGFALASTIARVIGDSSIGTALLWGAGISLTLVATWLRYLNVRDRIDGSADKDEDSNGIDP